MTGAPAGHIACFLASGKPDDARCARSWRPSESWLLVGICVLALGWAVGLQQVGWDRPISGKFQNGFRQSQTAISILFLARGGPVLAYETPVLGPPWSAPYEFPAYQWTVATAMRAFGTALVPTGRTVSLLAFYATLLILWLVLAELGVKPVHRLVFLTLVAVSPLYVFWSRCVLIESTALCLGAVYLWAALRASRTGAIALAVAAAVAGSVAALVKPTTWLAFGVLVALTIAAAAGRALSDGTVRTAAMRGLVRSTLWLAVPLALLAVWTAHADALKRLHPIAFVLQTSSPSFANFTYGPPAQRLTAEPWIILWYRTIADLVGRLPAVLPVLVAVVACRRRWGWIAICLLAFLVPFLTFMNLHVVHNYYAYANGIFFLAAMGWAIEGLLEGDRAHRVLAYGVLLACVGLAMLGYYRPGPQRDFPSYPGGDFHGFHAEQVANDDIATRLGHAVASATAPDDVIVAVGLDWSSELPLFASRRALMIPMWVAQDPDAPPLRDALARLDGLSIGALVSCPSRPTDGPLVARLIDRFGFDPVPQPVDVCALFTPRGASSAP